MKPSTVAQTFHAGNEQERVRLSIDKDSEVFTMLTLTDLYSDPITAIIREYSTNAYDSHVEAGTTAPIAVTQPTPIHLFFEVEDWGVGLSLDDVRHIYSKYGASTKRESNDVTGMLGLGCKSALSYAQTFTIRAVKDGELTVASVRKDHDGVGVIDILTHERTSLPNGVKVSVPVSHVDVSKFQQNIKDFFFYWRDGVRISGYDDGHPNIQSSNSEFIQISEDMYITRGLGRLRIIQGGVCYVWNRPRSHADTYDIVAYVPIGTVDFTPSREQLHYTPRTDDVLRFIYDEAKRQFVNWHRTEFLNLSDYEQRVMLAGFYGLESWAPSNVRTTRRASGHIAGYSVRDYNGTVAHQPTNANISDFGDESTHRYGKVITGFDLKRYVAAHTHKLRAAGIEPPFFVPTETGIDFDSFPVTCYDFRTSIAGVKIKSEKVERETRHYDYYENRYKRNDPLSTDDDLVYDVANADADLVVERLKLASRYFTKKKFVRIPERSAAKFKTLYPNAQRYDDWYAAEQGAFDAKTDPHIKAWIASNHDKDRFVDRLKIIQRHATTPITNKEIVRALNVTAPVSDTEIEWTTEVAEFLGVKIRWRNDRYPVISSHHYLLVMEISEWRIPQISDELVIYLNAKEAHDGR